MNAPLVSYVKTLKNRLKPAILKPAIIVASAAAAIALSACSGPVVDPSTLPKVAGCSTSATGHTPRSFGLTCDNLDQLNSLADKVNLYELVVTPKATAKNLDLSVFSGLRTVRVNNDVVKSLIFPAPASFDYITIKAAQLTHLELPPSIAELAISNVPALTEVEAFGVRIKSVTLEGPLKFDVGVLINRTDVKRLSLSNADLSALDLSVATNVDYLYLDNLQFNSAGLAGLTKLSTLILADLGSAALDLSQTYAKDINIQTSAFSSLRLPIADTLLSLSVSGHTAEVLTTVGGDKLQSLYISTSKPLKLLDINSLTALKSLTIKDTSLPNLALSAQKSLNSLGLYNSPMYNLDLTDNLQLANLALNELELTSLTIPATSPLKSLSLSNLKLQSLDLRNLAELKSVSITNVPLNSFSSTSVQQLELNNTAISQLDFTEASKLTRVSIENQLLTDVKLTANSLLSELWLDKISGISSLDLSQNSKLNKISILNHSLPCSALLKIDTQFGKANLLIYNLQGLTSCRVRT
jgi:hypothetical protein